MTDRFGWQPTATRNMLKKRAEVIADIRAFFYEREVLEVDVPSLSGTAVTDVNVESFSVSSISGGTNTATHVNPCYLTTSPEYYMKRLLAAEIGSIYSLARAFRSEPSGRCHQPEFVLLEWYRTDFDEHMLMDEITSLLLSLNPNWQVERISYATLFESTLGVDPHRAEVSELRHCSKQYIDLHDDEGWNRDDYLDLLMSHLFEPQMQGLVFVYDYPQSQAALARLGVDDKERLIARRFELYCDGIELANGYYELVDVAEQVSRFRKDNKLRFQKGLPVYPIDEQLIAALESGLPDCAGVAMGLERLLMVLLGKETIEEVMAFAL